MVKNTAQWLQRQYGIQIVEVPITTFPIMKDGNQSYLGPLEETLARLQQQQQQQQQFQRRMDGVTNNIANGIDSKCGGDASSCCCCCCRRRPSQLCNRLKVAVLDHIVSIPAIKLPILEMTQMIRKYTTTTETNLTTPCWTSDDDDNTGRNHSNNININEKHNHSDQNNNYQNNHSTHNSNNNETTDTTTTCRAGTFILVDGAHAWGQVPTSEISSILNQPSRRRHDGGDVDDTVHGIDAYLSNGHKWMYSPKGSAFLWVHPSRIGTIFPEPTVISSANSIVTVDDETSYSWYDDPMTHRYIYTSTIDYTSMLSLSRALDFQRWLGGEDVIHRYIRTLAVQAKEYLIRVWGTFALVPDSMEVYMMNIVLPIDGRQTDNTTTNATQIASSLQVWLYEERNMYVVIAQEPSTKYIYTRLSAQIYLEMDDFVRLGDAVLTYLEGYSSRSSSTTTS